MPDIDPFAGAYDAGAALGGAGIAPSGRLQVTVPMGAPPSDPFAGAVDAGPDALPNVQVTGGQAAKEGYLDTAGFGFRDEVKAASEASGLPSWLGGFRAPVGGVKLLMEQQRGERGEATKTYERELAKARELQRAAKEQHPAEYLTGQVGGALVGPGLGAGTGASMGARALRAGIAGAGTGGLYGYGSGEGAEDRAKQALVGAGVGFLGGGLLSPVADIAAAGLGKAGQLGQGIYNTIRAEINPESVEGVASRRLAAARAADEAARGGAPAFTPQEQQVAQQAGVSLAPIDVAGERTRAVARAAADISPEARQELGEFAGERYKGQSGRVAGFIKQMFGEGDIGATREALQETARRGNRPAYARAYAQGNRDIAMPDELMQAPAVQSAMRDAAVSGKNRAAAEGMGAFTPNQRNLQFWDYTYRNVRDAASAAGRAGRNEEASSLGGIANRMRDELDAQVPEFKQARQGAAAFFNAEDALEAGKNFVAGKMENGEAARQIAKMTPAERVMFQRGFASQLTDRILNLRDAEDVTTKAFLTSPNAKQRIQIALGKDGADRLETLIRVESKVDQLRKAMGNSKTNQFQLANRLLEGGGAFEAWEAAKESFGEGGFDPEKISTGHLLGSMLAFGGRYGTHRMAAVNEEIARRVGNMLVSDDPQILQRGIDIVRNSPVLMGKLRKAGIQGSEIVGRTARRGLARGPGALGANLGDQFGIALPSTQGPDVTNQPPP